MTSLNGTSETDHGHTSVVESLPLGRQLAYAVGQLGWAIVMGIIANYLVYFYLPPQEAQLPQIIPDVAIFGFISLVGLITMGGRLIDAITDPCIATLSDRSLSPRGRRISFMARGGLPMVLFMVMVFSPPRLFPTYGNAVWMSVMLIGFYIAYTAYVAPYFALIAELGHTAKERLNLSTYISFTFFLGTAIASQAPVLFGLLEGIGLHRLQAVRYTFMGLGAIALVCLYIPVFFINEKKYSRGQPSTAGVMESLRLTFKNPHFFPFALSDLVYFLALTMLQTGLIFYVTVLLRQPEQFYSTLFIIMGVGSFLLYPLVNIGGGRIGKKPLLQVAFLMFALSFALIAFLGLDWIPLTSPMQGIAVIALTFYPLAAFGILPNAILADIAEHDALKTGSHREAVYYGARTFMQKLGQMLAMLLFTSLLLLGRDVGDDLGIRSTGPVAAVFCLLGLVCFSLYNERKVMAESQSFREKNMGPL